MSNYVNVEPDPDECDIVIMSETSAGRQLHCKKHRAYWTVEPNVFDMTCPEKLETIRRELAEKSPT